LSKERHVFVIRRKRVVIGQYGEKKLKFPLFFDNMANFVHNIANRTLKVFQYVLVSYTCVSNGSLHRIQSVPWWPT
jgi:hypothetical protein